MADFAHAGELAALGAAGCWTLSAVTSDAAARRVGSLTFNLMRLALTCVLFVAYGLIFRGRWIPTDASAHNWSWLILSGLAGFSFGDLFLMRAFVLVGPRVGMLIMAMSPAITALIAWPALGQSLTPLKIVGMGVTLAGVAWVVRERHPDGPGVRPHSPTGVVMALLGALGQAVGVVLTTYGMTNADGTKMDPFAATQIRALAGTAGFAALALLLGRYGRLASALRDGRTLALTVVGAFLGTFLGVGLQLASLNRIPAGVATTFTSIVPVTIMPFTILLYRERVSFRAAAGACVAVGGVALLFL